jgi:RNA polymerase sigma-70 factor (ECF subfamily)
MSANTLAVTAEQLAAVYDKLRGLASCALRNERSGHTLQTTALVNETWLQLMGSDWEKRIWSEPRLFFADFVRKMRQVLVDHARARRTIKRGGKRHRVQLTDVMALYEDTTGLAADVSELLDRMATSLDHSHSDRRAQVAEHKIFGDRTEEDIAQILGVSEATVRRDWQSARVWLGRALREAGGDGHASGTAP